MPRKYTLRTRFGELEFSDSDVINPSEYIPAGEYNPHNVRPFLFYGVYGWTIGVAFADCLQDALDELADSGKLDSYMVSESDLPDYGPEEEGISRLGNAGEPFDIGGVQFLELPNPALSFVALYEGMDRDKEASE